MYKLVFFVPASHLEAVKQAVFAAGAGRIGDYEHCAWQVLGEGQFRPLAGSTPFIGRQDALEIVAEYRVELVCAAPHIAAAVSALRAAHLAVPNVVLDGVPPGGEQDFEVLEQVSINGWPYYLLLAPDGATWQVAQLEVSGVPLGVSKEQVTLGAPRRVAAA